ncbi:uncharacterized protein LOC126655342 [Mercurialis annua]|uniref:uncharacterized protein LOC126655342 n=1 Tax=Mercurialis annua TaxID=3986 RepID=UPI002160FBD7|nr:uncharacterized protein LOC126655342 [Mercurialis annua]
METREYEKVKSEFQEKILQIFIDFSTRIAKIEELGAVGSRLLRGFHQGLEFLRRAPINTKAELMKRIIEANETERVKSYFAAGCINNQDRIQNLSKLNTCLLGLHDHLTKAKSILNELENLLEDLTSTISSFNKSLSLENEALCGKFEQATINQEERSPSSPQELAMTDYAVLMGIIYSMVKQDYAMQEKVVMSLNLKSLSEEMESYCLMWSLRPFVNDEIMNQAWKLIQ